MMTLCLTKPGYAIHRTGDRFQIRCNGSLVQELPAIKVSQISAFAGVSITPKAIQLALEQGIDVVFLTRYGKFLGRMHPPVSPHGMLRHKQHCAYEDLSYRILFAQSVLTGKINNQIHLIRRLNLDGGADSAIHRLESLRHKIQETAAIDALMGVEGAASTAYFDTLREAGLGQWRFLRREQHPPPDPVNILLSLGYTILYSRTIAAIERVGMDPYCGLLHEFRYGHAALASDLMESFRSAVVDAVVVQGIRKRMLSRDAFIKRQDGWHITDEGVQTFFSLLQDRFQTIARAATPAEKKAFPLHSWIEEQARQLARSLSETGHTFTTFQWED